MSSFAAPAPLHRPPRSGHTVARVLSITALIGIAVALAVVAWRTERHANELEAAPVPSRSSAHRTLVDLLNAETGQRGFLVSGDPDYLQPYRDGSGAANSDLATLTRASRTVPPLTADVAALHMLTRSKLSELDETSRSPGRDIATRRWASSTPTPASGPWTLCGPALPTSSVSPLGFPWPPA